MKLHQPHTVQRLLLIISIFTIICATRDNEQCKGLATQASWTDETDGHVRASVCCDVHSVWISEVGLDWEPIQPPLLERASIRSLSAKMTPMSICNEPEGAGPHVRHRCTEEFGYTMDLSSVPGFHHDRWYFVCFGYGYHNPTECRQCSLEYYCHSDECKDVHHWYWLKEINLTETSFLLQTHMRHPPFPLYPITRVSEVVKYIQPDPRLAASRRHPPPPMLPTLIPVRTVVPRRQIYIPDSKMVAAITDLKAGTTYEISSCVQIQIPRRVLSQPLLQGAVLQHEQTKCRPPLHITTLVNQPPTTAQARQLRKNPADLRAMGDRDPGANETKSIDRISTKQEPQDHATSPTERQNNRRANPIIRSSQASI